MFIVTATVMSILVLLTVRRFHWLSAPLAYFLFFSTALLSMAGFVGTLTGFNATENNGWFFGVSFITPFLAYLLIERHLLVLRNPIQFFAVAIFPGYMFTGPFPNGWSLGRMTMRVQRFRARFRVLFGDLVLGLFFSTVIARALTNFLFLKDSAHPVDIVAFAFIFEFYVYFNFAGFSMIAWAMLRLFGIRAVRNFAQPFGANSVVEYWRRWHVSLSGIIRTLFYIPIRRRGGIYVGVLATFLASAIWHGVTLNFFVWGIFHSACWIFSYRLLLSRWSLFLNFSLLIFSIIIGRIIFAEINSTNLLKKFEILLLLRSPENSAYLGYVALSVVDCFHLTLAICFVAMEIVLPRIGYAHKDYRHLRGPATSIILFLYVVLIFKGFDVAPIYGAR